MITNREIASERLLHEALDEVLASARENGFSEADLSATLRERADALAVGEVETPPRTGDGTDDSQP